MLSNTPVAGVDYAFLRQLVYEHAQNVLEPARDYLFETRLLGLMRRQGLMHLEELVQRLRLRRDPTLERQIAEAMTTNETSFFRDGRPFELLRDPLLPALIEARRPVRSLRFWSAACSTGQEAYSIAMLLHEHFPQIALPSAGWSIRIEGTDISQEVVQRCQSGSYPRIEINRGLPARNIVRYFDHQNEDYGAGREESWVIKPELRSITNFRQANLCADVLPFGSRFDVVFLRNVMLYFSQETRKKLLANVHRLLAPDGVLFLGSSEQPADPTLWTPVLAGGTCYYRPR
jgi:chemotaxis protein methyltransferase CheR